MKKLFATLLIGVSFQLSAMASRTSELRYVIEPVTALPLEEVWALAESQRIEIGYYVLLVKRYDSEYGQSRHDLKYCGILMVGSSDVGSKPVGFRVLTSASCRSIVASKVNETGAAAFVVDMESIGSFRLEVSREGQVLVDGKRRAKLAP